jgi:hypothetical protein
LRDVAGTQPWTPAGSFLITLASNKIEVIENNLRVLKLTAPIRLGRSWKGNTYLSPNPYGSDYSFSNDDNMFEWDFTFDESEATATINGKTFNDVITVTAIDESINETISDPRAYAYKNLAVDRYAKGVGLIFQEFIMWEYQPNPGGLPYKVGFGVKRTILDHN